MSLYDKDSPYTKVAVAEVNSFAKKVYGWMTMGLSLTAAVAFGVLRSGLYVTLLPYWWVWAFATLGIALVISAKVKTLSFPTMAALFMSYAFCEGVFFGTVLPVYAAQYGGQVIWTAFATAAALFGAAVLYGVFTKSDLTRIGRLLAFGVICLFAITLLYFVLSFFMRLTWLNLAISYIGLVIFVGLTAWDAQQIRQMSRQVAHADSGIVYKAALMMALSMYINVIMIFWYLVQIFSIGNNRR